MSKCLGCLIDLKSGQTYCNRCKKNLFDNRKIAYKLDFDKNRFLQIQSGVKFSISGIQDKISLQIIDNKLSPTDKNGEYILKPIPILSSNVKFIDDISTNEHFIMQLANQVFKIVTAENALIEFSDGEFAYITKRFDKRGSKKLKQEDFCSLAGLSEENFGKNYKYDYSYTKVAQLIKRFLPTYKIEIRKFYKQILFNYLVCNGDAHLKNFSILERNSGDYGLSPSYDLLSTSIHFPYEDRVALELFDDYETQSFIANSFLAKDDFIKFAEFIDVDIEFANRVIEEFSEKKEQVFDLLDRCFMSNGAKEVFKKNYLDRLKAISYSYKFSTFIKN